MKLESITIGKDLYKYGGEYFDQTSPRIGVAYKYEDYVLPFFGSVTNPEKMTVPGIYLEEVEEVYGTGKYSLKLRNGNEHVVFPGKKDTEHRPENIKILDIKEMMSDIQKNTDIKQSSGDANIYVPKILPKDDLGMRILKYGLGKKGIVYKDYHHRFEKAWDRTNIMRMIETGGTLKLSTMEMLADIFDFGFVVGIYDKDADIVNPINKDGVDKLMLFRYGQGRPLDEYELVDVENIVEDEK